MTEPPETASDFWEGVYRRSSSQTSGRPSAVLERFASDRTAGAALDLGCGKGDDAVWLAKRGWRVTAVDVSSTALGYARENAERSGVADLIAFACLDLAGDIPGGRFDLVSAIFLESPVDFPRSSVLRRAAGAVAAGGLLLAVSHGSRAPWSWGDPDQVFPTARESLDALNLPAADWREVFVGGVDRRATGPEGRTAVVVDTIIALARRPAG